MMGNPLKNFDLYQLEGKYHPLKNVIAMEISGNITSNVFISTPVLNFDYIYNDCPTHLHLHFN